MQPSAFAERAIPVVPAEELELPRVEKPAARDKTGIDMVQMGTTQNYQGPKRRWDDGEDDGKVIFQRSNTPSGDEGREIFVHRRRKTDTERQQVIFDSGEKESRDLPPVVNEVPPLRTVWSRKPAGNPKFEEAEQRAIKKTLKDLVAPELKIGNVRMTDDTSKVFITVESRDDVDISSVGYLQQTFREKTGRELVVEFPKSRAPIVEEPVAEFPTERLRKPERPETFAPRPDPVSPVEDSRREEDARKVESAKKKEEEDKSTIFLRRKAVSEMAWTPALPPKPKSKAEQGSDDHDDGVKKIRSRGVRRGGSAQRSNSGGGGGGRTHGNQKPRRQKEHHEEKKEKLEHKEHDRGTPVREHVNTETGLEIDITRMGLHDMRDEDRREGQGGGQQNNSACPTCGTELPPSQAQNCPVCAQSGQEIMALAKTNYRFAGSKMFATADTVVASDSAKQLFQTGALDTVASLRYWPKIPGHKEIWNLRKQA